MNMTHTGELGYVFYIPNEFALHVYNSIIEAGKVICNGESMDRLALNKYTWKTLTILLKLYLIILVSF